MTESAHLRLPKDHAILAPSLTVFLADWRQQHPDQEELADIIQVIARACLPIAGRLTQGHLTGDPTAVVGANQSGDAQKALDIGAHDHFLAAFKTLPVARVLSEEAEEVEELDLNARYDIAMDPIDGSGSIGIGAPLGGLFAVFPAGTSFLRPGREIIAAAYVSFGHSLDFGFSLGDGVAIATYDPGSDDFYVDTPKVALKPDTSTIALNASYQRRWAAGYQRYVADMMAGEDGPRLRNFNMRWIAAAVGDLHRILRRGGIFMYPEDTRDGYENGFLRLAYEAFPIAYLIEQAGGRATDGIRDILDLRPAHLHDRIPLVFGSRAEVETVADYLTTYKET